jgi:RNA polymerase sigma-70 factor, ECF subfamily
VTFALAETGLARRGASAEASLRERVQQGEETALADLVDRYYVSLARVALLYLGRRGEAYEAVQSLFGEALRRIASLEHEDSLERGLLAVLVRVLRSKALAAGAVPSTPPEPRRLAAGTIGRRASGGAREGCPLSFGHVQERVEPGELDELVREVVAALPLDQREVVILRDVERWEAAEVARLVGCSETEQRRLLHRARSCIRRVLEAYAEALDEPRAA